MPSLLELPRELLQEVVYYTLQPPFNLAASPENTNPDEWMLSGSPRRSSRLRAKDVEPLMSLYKRKPLYSLSMTCRQMQMEVADVWKREGEKVACEVDIMVDKHGDFLVTWLMFPQTMLDNAALGWDVGRINIRVRFFSHSDGALRENTPARRRYSELFNRFVAHTLRRGPAPPPPPPPYKGRTGLSRFRVPRGGNVTARQNAPDTLSVLFQGTGFLDPSTWNAHVGLLKDTVNCLMGSDATNMLPWYNLTAGFSHHLLSRFDKNTQSIRKYEIWFGTFLQLEYEYVASQATMFGRPAIVRAPPAIHKLAN
ncbi:hypothetical protein K505DRAFT_390056 [Melanomma pulvis-pyrius CBS 109.77]|uniref:F-box domain-containing protein n=1 Tax=Melanomma pulvis-pyrius CBS 109.77 TaxID=1314802 RepID=A0A6A6XTX7_9PLEO|nr:hypothetical protein K505DRAFT_390056 [Melanomma pulvis-pyrius CBS 109.77]